MYISLYVRSATIFLVGEMGDEVRGWLRTIYAGRMADLVLQAESFHRLSGGKRRIWIATALDGMRRILRAHGGLYDDLGKEAAFIKKFIMHVGIGRVERMIGMLCRMRLLLDRHAHARLTFLALSLELCL